MTPDDIAADRAVIAAATPGPWRVWPHPGLPLSAIDGVTCTDGCMNCADAEFASRARTSWEPYIDEVERLRAEVERLRDQNCDHAHPCTCGSGAHPRQCLRHPLAYDAHVAELNLIAEESDKRGELSDEVERLRAARPRQPQE